MTATIRNTVRAIRWLDVLFVVVLVVAVWISKRLSVEVPQYLPMPIGFICAFGVPIVLVLVWAVKVLKFPSRRERARSRPSAGDPTPDDPASGKTREPETGAKS